MHGKTACYALTKFGFCGRLAICAAERDQAIELAYLTNGFALSLARAQEIPLAMTASIHPDRAICCAQIILPGIKETEMSVLRSWLLCALVVVGVVGCGGGGGGGGSDAPAGGNGSGGGGNNQGENTNNGNGVPADTQRYEIGGNVSGLTGTMILTNNTDVLSISADGPFQFPTSLVGGANYQVQIQAQPTGQECTVSGGVGVTQSIDISNISITCQPNTYPVGGTISGLAGTLTLTNNGTPTFSTSSDGPFNLTGSFPIGTSYQINILSQPATQTCAIANGSGIAGTGNNNNVSITCTARQFSIGGTVSGSRGSVVLKNGSEQITVSQDGVFVFLGHATTGTPYQVEAISYGAPTKRCSVTSGAGMVGIADVNNIQISCISKPIRYEEQTYSSFISSNGMSDLEGTWILLAEGTLSMGEQVAGINPREDYELWSRATVRIRKDPSISGDYFVFTCGPGGARNTKTTPSSPTNFFVPFFYDSTSSWLLYGMTVQDATTMHRSDVSKAYGFGSGSNVIGWNLSWTLKRISDDPFHIIATTKDNLTNHVEDAGCIYESDGSYKATENDGSGPIEIKSGPFFWSSAYSVSPFQLYDDANSFSSRFFLKELTSFNSRHFDSVSSYTYRTTDGAVVNALHMFTNTSSSHQVNAVSADSLKSSNATLEISP